MSEPGTSSGSNKLMLRYAGLATQWMIIILISVYGGKKLDFWLGLKGPVFAWILPLLSIVGMLIHIIRDTSAPKKK